MGRKRSDNSCSCLTHKHRHTTQADRGRPRSDGKRLMFVNRPAEAKHFFGISHLTTNLWSSLTSTLSLLLSFSPRIHQKCGFHIFLHCNMKVLPQMQCLALNCFVDAARDTLSGDVILYSNLNPVDMILERNWLYCVTALGEGCF